MRLNSAPSISTPLRAKHTLPIVLAFCLTVMPWTASWSQPTGGGFGGGFGGQQEGRAGGDPNQREQRHAKFMSEIGLSPEQQAKIKEIRESGKQQTQGLQNQLQQKRQALQQYMASPNATEGEAMARMNSLFDLQRQMAQQRIKSMFAMRNIMTPEQREKFQAMMKERKGSGGAGRGFGQGKGPGGGRFGGQFQGGGGGRPGGRFQGGGGRFEGGPGGQPPANFGPDSTPMGEDPLF